MVSNGVNKLHVLLKQSSEQNRKKFLNVTRKNHHPQQRQIHHRHLQTL